MEQDMSISETTRSRSPEETLRIAQDLLPRLPACAVLALHGELGAGKTHFVQGLAAALGIEQPVTSPTYTLIQEYAGDPPLTHVDLYRVQDENEALMLGLEDLFDDPVGIKAIEWAERAQALLPSATIHITLRHGAAPDERTIEIAWPGDATER